MAFFSRATLVLFVIVTTFPMLTGNEQTISKQQVDIQQIIDHLPESFEKDRCRDFFSRCNEFSASVTAARFNELVFHQSVVREVLFEKSENDIQVWCDFQPISQEKVGNKVKWHPRTVGVSCGKDCTYTIKELIPSQNILLARDKYYHSGMSLTVLGEVGGYGENSDPDGKRGFSIDHQNANTRIITLTDFEKSTKRQVQFDAQYKIVTDRTGPVTDYAGTPANLTPGQAFTERTLQKFHETLFSWASMKLAPKPKNIDAEIQEKITHVNEIIECLQNRRHDELLEHDIFVNSMKSCIAVFFRWAQDKTFQLELVQAFDDEKEGTLGFLLTFQGNGYPLFYRVGNLLTIMNRDPNYAFSGVEMTFHENGTMDTYQSFEKGKVSRSLKWNKEGKVVSDKSIPSATTSGRP